MIFLSYICIQNRNTKFSKTEIKNVIDKYKQKFNNGTLQIDNLI